MATCSGLHGLNLPDEGIMMSYLPLAHAYEVSCRSSFFLGPETYLINASAFVSFA